MEEALNYPEVLPNKYQRHLFKSFSPKSWYRDKLRPAHIAGAIYKLVYNTVKYNIAAQIV